MEEFAKPSKRRHFSLSASFAVGGFRQETCKVWLGGGQAQYSVDVSLVKRTSRAEC
jgi:hypothetical protein